MTERSWPWPGVTVGDAGPYTADEWDDMFERRFGSGAAPYNDRGVIRNWANELEVTDGGANQADVDTGAALVHGKHYDSDAVENIVVPNSVGAWREDLICLQSVTAAQTIRIARHANPADGVGYPAPTQTAATWEIPLAAVRINNVGAITLITDLRDYVSNLIQPKEIWARPFPDTPSGATRILTGSYEGVRLDSPGETCAFVFKVPIDFKDIVQARVILQNSVGGPGTFDWTVTTNWGTCGEDYNGHADGDTADGVPAGATQAFICVDVTDALRPNLAAGDYAGLRFVLDALATITWIAVFGLEFRYS